MLNLAKFIRPQRHMVDILFTLALFCVFAASSLMIVIIGAKVYENTVSQMETNYNSRTACSYIRSKVRQSDSSDCINIKETPLGENAIVLEDNINGNTYETWIYQQSGKLMELFIEQGSPVVLENGQELMDISNFNVTYADTNLLLITAEDLDGNQIQMYLAIDSDSSL
jgi:hypothetical protein